MGITRSIQTKFNQSAIYWGNPVNNGRGGYTFSPRQQMMVRWEDEVENFAKDARSRIQIGKDGREFRPNVIVYTTAQPVGGWDLDGYLCLGTLQSTPSETHPAHITGAYEIKQINTYRELGNPAAVIYKISL